MAPLAPSLTTLAFELRQEIYSWLLPRDPQGGPLVIELPICGVHHSLHGLSRSCRNLNDEIEDYYFRHHISKVSISTRSNEADKTSVRILRRLRKLRFDLAIHTGYSDDLGSRNIVGQQEWYIECFLRFLLSIDGGHPRPRFKTVVLSWNVCRPKRSFVYTGPYAFDRGKFQSERLKYLRLFDEIKGSARTFEVGEDFGEYVEH